MRGRACLPAGLALLLAAHPAFADAAPQHWTQAFGPPMFLGTLALPIVAIALAIWALVALARNADRPPSEPRPLWPMLVLVACGVFALALMLPNA